MDIEKLIERLKSKNFERDYDCTPFECGVFGLLDDSATALSTLQTENQALRNAANGFEAENEKLRADVVRFNDMLASYQNVLVPELRVENENLKERIEDTRLEWYAKGFGEVIAEVKRVRAELEQKEKYYEQMVDALAATESAELEQVKAERDAAVEDLHKLCPAWKWDGQKED